ncbi:hypothetical protein N8T08_007694 [Aspergillus melleus]|uniref:Uncharacterized protein n=1 Tax=Aspergillus melleus TaxID=138277 RepID=A0ACC3BEM9_9EURO|nr:hypothetical protein N8T08_007694 [Aspergillus melleus]
MKDKTGLLDELDWGNAVLIAGERLYEAEINGVRVGDQVLAPGLQPYNYRYTYDTHNVTKLVKRGVNGIGVVMGEGRYSGILTAAGNYRNNYGDTLGHLALLVVTLRNGTKIEIPTGTQWQANTGPLDLSEIYNGEKYDSWLEARLKGWSTGQFNSSNWLPVKELDQFQGALIPLDGPPVKITQEIQPQDIFMSPSNKTVVDFGHNLVGWVRLNVTGPAGTNITLRHAEVLENGELALRPLRRTSATDWLVLHWNAREHDGCAIFRPRHPARNRQNCMEPVKPSAIWGDIAVGGPFNHYLAYGDIGMLREQYEQARAWVDSGIPRDESGLWQRNTYQFRDWLDPKAPADDPGDTTTNKYLVADAYLVRMTEYKLSLALDNQEAAASYTKQRRSLINAFRSAWMSNGTIANQIQTAYALGLQFGLFAKGREQDSAVSTLQKHIVEKDHLVGTGFALAANNATEDFYSMLLQTKVPSSLYQVVQGGTTTWERWDSLLPGGRVNPGEITSFNHYAFGSVADWTHQAAT